jgi:hypothetical protein
MRRARQFPDLFPSTGAVDNFVDNRAAPRRGVNNGAPPIGLLKN